MRLAILGASHPRIQQYLHSLRTFPDVEVIGLIEENAKHGQALAAKFGIRYEAKLVSLQPLDAVIVGAAARPELVEQAAKAAPAILCEIPFAYTLAEAEKIIQTCIAQSASLYPALSLRLLPVFKSLKQMLDQNDLNQILSAKLQYQARKLSETSNAEHLSGRDMMLANLTQVVDLLQWLLGTEVTELYAETGSGLLHSSRAVEDSAIVSVALANGAYATLDVSLALPPTYPAPEDLKVEILGTGGWIRVDAYHQKIEAYASESVNWVNWGSDRITELLREVVNAGASLPTAEDALRAQKIALSVYQ